MTLSRPSSQNVVLFYLLGGGINPSAETYNSENIVEVCGILRAKHLYTLYLLVRL